MLDRLRRRNIVTKKKTPEAEPEQAVEEELDLTIPRDGSGRPIRFAEDGQPLVPSEEEN